MFERVPSFLYSVSDREKIEKEVEAVNHLGCAGEFTTITSLPFPVEGAIRYPAQAQFHPLLFLEGIARDIEIYEKTRVLRVEEHRVITEAGPVVEAEHVIFATHYPFINRPGYYFMRMHQVEKLCRSILRCRLYGRDVSGHGYQVGLFLSQQRGVSDSRRRGPQNRRKSYRRFS